MLTEIDAYTDSEKRGIVRPATIFSRTAVASRRIETLVWTNLSLIDVY